LRRELIADESYIVIASYNIAIFLKCRFSAHLWRRCAEPITAIQWLAETT